MDFNLHCNIPFGDYSQVYERTGNDMTDCTVGAICLEPNYNLQGGYKFYRMSSINTVIYQFLKLGGGKYHMEM